MDGMWCLVGRTVARSVVAAGDHGGERKEGGRLFFFSVNRAENMVFCQL